MDAADTYPTAAIAPGAAILAAGGTPVGPDIQIVTDADHQIGTARRGCGRRGRGAMWISFAVPIVVSSLSLHPLISRSPLRRSQPVKSGPPPLNPLNMKRWELLLLGVLAVTHAGREGHGPGGAAEHPTTAGCNDRDPAFVRNGRLDVLAVNAMGRALYSQAFDSPALDTPGRPLMVVTGVAICGSRSASAGSSSGYRGHSASIPRSGRRRSREVIRVNVVRYPSRDGLHRGVDDRAAIHPAVLVEVGVEHDNANGSPS